MSLIMNSFTRYLTVGAFSNLALYVMYLAITAAGLWPFAAMTIVFLTGIALTYWLNSRWSFRTVGNAATAVGYTLVYMTGYVVNLVAFYVLYEMLNVPHQLTMLLAMGITAIFIYLNLKLWIFSGKREDQPS